MNLIRKIEKIFCNLLQDHQDYLLGVFKFIIIKMKCVIKGFKNLNPKLTVVKKIPNEPSQKIDDILPSVMT